MLFGIDIGGTTVKTAFVNTDGTVLHKAEIPTEPESGVRTVVERLHDVFLREAKSAGISTDTVQGIGVGVPGFLDNSGSIVIEAPNLGWKDVNIGQMVHSAFGLPVAVENDANLAALGESWAGSGRNAKTLLFATVGTGIGAGIVLDGKLHRGASGMAGEIGHLVVQPKGGLQCNCGQVGCLETLASATAIIRAAKKRLSGTQAESTIRGAADVFALAEGGNPEATAVIEDAAQWLGYGFALVATALNPDGIVIGGGVSRARVFVEAVESSFLKYTLPRVQVAKISAAVLGNDAGVIGAARLAEQLVY